jgi:hypothetical protein
MSGAVQEPEGGIDNTLAAAFAQVREQVAAAESQASAEETLDQDDAGAVAREIDALTATTGREEVLGATEGEETGGSPGGEETVEAPVREEIVEAPAAEEAAATSTGEEVLGAPEGESLPASGSSAMPAANAAPGGDQDAVPGGDQDDAGAVAREIEALTAASGPEEVLGAPEGERIPEMAASAGTEPADEEVVREEESDTAPVPPAGGAGGPG